MAMGEQEQERYDLLKINAAKKVCVYFPMQNNLAKVKIEITKIIRLYKYIFSC